MHASPTRPARAPTMSLPHAILTALVERPSTGAELARRFDRSIGYFWQATHQQIYRELGRLEDAGWVASDAVEDGRGRQRSYRVLPAGRRELKRWVGTHEGPRAVRDEMMVRLRAEAAVGPSGLAESIRAQLEQERARRALYRDLEARQFPGGGQTREQKLRHLVLKAGIRSVTSRIQLCEEALEILAMPSSKP